ncbi:MAG: DUF2075 domain-containing protein [Sulfurovum sp.]|nr:MAG: DUF2075 domain-containing protein [Sulfurovum sp.]
MSYFFELPLITDLTEDQQMALDELKSIAISGGAGTGKTVVSLWRHIQNMETSNKYSVIVTYTKTLGHYLSMSVTAIENNKKYKLKNITPPSRQVFTLKDFNKLEGQWKVHEIIIDEAQDLKLETLKKIKTHADTISYGADFNQQLYEKTVNEKEIKNLFGKNIEYNLQQNFRNSYHILNFVKGILPNFHISQSTLDELKDENIGIKPIMFISNDFEKEIEKIIEIINEFKSDTHNIAILLPFGETNDYTKEQSVDKYYDELKNKGISCSKYYNKMKTDNIEIDNIHITTFKSAKGLEFNTVIIPEFHKFKDNVKKVSVVNEEDYYVAFTRTKKNLYLMSSEKLDFIDNDICEIEYLKDNYNSKYISNRNNDDIPF